LCNNTITYNIDWGICGRSCDSTSICYNNITDNTYGIFLITSNNNIISNNFIQKNEYGILLDTDSSFNTISGNWISKNINGTFLIYSSNNIISGNNISENVNGLYLYEVIFISEYFCKHKIEFNNFINNNRDAFFRIEINVFLNIFKTFNKWRNNYWGGPRYNPKPIFGTLRLTHFPLPAFTWINIDWNPALKPYDI
jgi:parallel beta-helix repeat protein